LATLPGAPMRRWSASAGIEKRRPTSQVLLLAPRESRQ
jgi:hypothetical protein